MTIDPDSKRAVRPARRPQRQPILAMLEARSVALVGASPRPGSFGQRMIEEVSRSPAGPQVHLVNPRYARIGERTCHRSLADLSGPVDLVLLAVPDGALEQQLGLAARHGDASAVIFGNAHEDLGTRNTGGTDPGTRNTAGTDPGDADPGGTDPGGTDPGRTADSAAGPPLRERLAAIARSAGMELCGAGCMGFVNVARGLRAIGYTEPDPLPAGPVALVTHSGSVFSALLRTRRAIGFTLAVSSGQELVTAAPAYLEYAIGLPETRVLALVLETIRQPDKLRQVLARAAERDLPVVLLTAGSSARGRMMVTAHSGALAAADGGWEALARAYGVHRVRDLAEMADTLELFAIGRRARRRQRSRGVASVRGSGQERGTATMDDQEPAHGIATVHDSGLERAHAADLAEQLGVPFAQLSQATTAALAGLLDPGLAPANPLDVWGTGAGTRELFAGSLAALADDPSVDIVALAVDLVPELDGDRSYPEAVLDAAGRTSKPLAVLANLGSAADPRLADQLRQAGVPVLEGMRTGLLALRHLLDHASPAEGAARPGASPSGDATAPGHPDCDAAAPSHPDDASRRDRGAAILAAATGGAPLLDLLREYGITSTKATPAGSASAALAAASSIGYPVVLKTDEPSILHKSDVGGVILGIGDPVHLAAAYGDLAARLGPRVLVCQTAPPGTELALGIARDPDLGPLIVVGAGGVLVELLADRAVALPPVNEAAAGRLLGELRVSALLAGARGAPPADLPAIVRAITGLSALACELGDAIESLDVNPLICGPAGAIAADAIAVPRRTGI
jgi:acetate---CoA ligase (ADP-forming)